MLHGRADESVEASPGRAGPPSRRRVELVAAGARAAVVTAAAAGAAVARAAGACGPAPRVPVVRNPIGAGDVLAAGLCAALERGSGLLDAAVRGVAAAAAGVQAPLAGDLDVAVMDGLLAQVRANPAG